MQLLATLLVSATVFSVCFAASEDLSEAEINSAVKMIQQMEPTSVLPSDGQVRQSLKELFGDEVSEKELDAMVQQVKDFDKEPTFDSMSDAELGKLVRKAVKGSDGTLRVGREADDQELAEHSSDVLAHVEDADFLENLQQEVAVEAKKAAILKCRGDDDCAALGEDFFCSGGNCIAK